MFWFVLLDAVVALLLAATIVYAVALNRKLGQLRGNRGEIEQNAAAFNDAIAKAEASVTQLKVSSDELRLQVDKAQSLKDDLTLLIARGDAVADALEEAVRAGRKQREGVSRPRQVSPVGGTASVETWPDRSPSGAATPRTEAERELLRALASGR